jgi:hypothetical protein
MSATASMMLADGNGDSRARSGLELDATRLRHGHRGQRFAIVVNDGVVDPRVHRGPGRVRSLGGRLRAQAALSGQGTPAVADQNHRILFARSPQGLPVPEDFGADVVAVPKPGAGQFLSRTLWLSLDPYYRNVMKNSQIYADRLAPGDVMVGETVAQVVESRILTTSRATTSRFATAGSSTRCRTARACANSILR